CSPSSTSPPSPGAPGSQPGCCPCCAGVAPCRARNRSPCSVLGRRTRLPRPPSRGRGESAPGGAQSDLGAGAGRRIVAPRRTAGRVSRRGAIAILLALMLHAASASAVQRPDADAAPVVRGPLVVHHWGAPELAARLLDAVEATPGLSALPADVLADGDPIHIHLAPDEARFDSLTGGRAPEWGAGIALPDAGVIVLPAYALRRSAPQDLARTLRHELAHVALHRYLAPARIPRWFHEGYARWAAGELDWEAGWQLRVAFLLHRAPPLDSLTL